MIESFFIFISRLSNIVVFMLIFVRALMLFINKQRLTVVSRKHSTIKPARYSCGFFHFINS